MVLFLILSIVQKCILLFSSNYYVFQNGTCAYSLLPSNFLGQKVVKGHLVHKGRWLLQI